jgi:hypothetical protein
MTRALHGFIEISQRRHDLLIALGAFEIPQHSPNEVNHMLRVIPRLACRHKLRIKDTDLRQPSLACSRPTAVHNISSPWRQTQPTKKSLDAVNVLRDAVDFLLAVGGRGQLRRRRLKPGSMENPRKGRLLAI